MSCVLDHTRLNIEHVFSSREAQMNAIREGKKHI